MKSKVNFKNLILSVVALILVMMLTVGVTYSWIEDVKRVEFRTDDAGEDTPLKTGTDINATAEIVQDANNSTINLGNILTDSDLKDSNGNFKTNIDMNTVNAKKGYFYESGDMHLSPCYSDGVDFYFPKEGGGFRKGNKNDENVNYLDFTFKVSSPTANTAYWFDKNGQVPWFSIMDSNNSSNHIEAACMSITVDGTTKVFTWTPRNNISKNGLTTSGNTYSSIRPADYTYGDSYNANNANTLFTVAKGTSKNVNVKIWIDAGYNLSGATISDIDIKLTSSWSKMIKFNVEDKTSGTWAIDTDSKFYVAFPDYYDAYEDWEANKNFFEFDSYDRSNHTATFNIPAVYSGEYAYIYRCSSSGWDHGDNQDLPNSNDALPHNDHPIDAHNYWKTTIPVSYKPTNSDTYKFYGGAYDSTAAKAIEGSTGKATHMGCGTWGEIEKIELFSKYRYYNERGAFFGHSKKEDTATNFATYDLGDNKKGHVYIRDFSDENTVKTIYTYEMNWDSTNEKWWAYAPTTSALIQFYYYSEKTDSHKGWWGYRCDNNKCPQQRPLKKTGDGATGNETGYETKYHITGNHGDKKGVCGYWDNHNCVYLIRKGNFSSRVYLKDYMWLSGDMNGGTSNVQNDSYPGHNMTLDTHQTYQGDNYTAEIYKSSSLYDWDHMYDFVKFSGEVSTSDNTRHYTNGLYIYPGCYWDDGVGENNGKWYGDVNLSTINTEVTDTSEDTDVSGGITTYPPSDNNVYLSVELNGDIRYYKIGNAVNDSVNIQLSQNNNYTTRLIKNGTNYGRNDNDPNSYINPNGGEFTYYQASQPERMHVSTAGKYNVKIKSVGNNSYIIKFTSVAS